MVQLEARVLAWDKVLLCQTCGVVLAVKPRGRKPQHCPECREKYRKVYKHAKYKQRPRIPRRSTQTLTVPSNRGSLKQLLEHERSQLARVHRNLASERKRHLVGGSGFDEVMPRTIDHTVYACRAKQFRHNETVLLRFMLDFTKSLQRILDEPLSGTDPWAWPDYEFNRRLRQARKGDK